MRKLLAGIYLVYAALLFITLMLLAFPVVVLATAILPVKAGKKVAFWALRTWALLFSTFSFFWLKTVNRSKVDTSRPYIYTGNHSSYLDAVAVAYAIPQDFSPLGKIEMTKIPVFGWIYKSVVVLIDRSSKESRAISVQNLKQEIALGTSVLIFPEGTMNQTPALLGPFYDGAFRIAIETQTPVLPFIICNARKLLPRKDPLHIRPGVVSVVFGTPIEVTGYTIADVEILRERVYTVMEEMMASYAPVL